MNNTKVTVSLIAGGLFLIAQFIYQVVLTGPYSLGGSLVMGVIIVAGAVYWQRQSIRRKRRIA